jgi:hypothetical protein
VLGAGTSALGLADRGPFPDVDVIYLILSLAIGLGALLRKPWAWHVVLGGLLAMLVASLYYNAVFIRRDGHPPFWGMVGGALLWAANLLWFGYFYRRREMFGAPERWQWVERLVPHRWLQPG